MGATALVILAASPASAQVVPGYAFDAPPPPAWGTPNQPAPPEPPPAVRRWYGGWILATDGLALVAAAAGSSANAELAPRLWTAAWLLDGPVVHAVHGRAGAAVGSFALRAGLPVVGGGLGYLIETGGVQNREKLFDGLAGIVIGGVVGLAAAEAIDAAALAWRTEPDAPRSATALRVAFAPRRGGAAVSLGATF